MLEPKGSDLTPGNSSSGEESPPNWTKSRNFTLRFVLDM